MPMKTPATLFTTFGMPYFVSDYKVSISDPNLGKAKICLMLGAFRSCKQTAAKNVEKCFLMKHIFKRYIISALKVK